MIRFMDSHAYPGCPAVAEDLPQEGSVHVEFSGGTVAGGRIPRRDDGGIALTIAPTAPPRERRSRKKPGCWKTGARIAGASAAGSTGTDRRQ